MTGREAPVRNALWYDKYCKTLLYVWSFSFLCLLFAVFIELVPF